MDKHRDTHGVEPICKVLQIAPSGYRRHAAQQRNPDLRCARAKTDDTLKPEIQRVWQANMRVYGAEKVYKQMRRERITVARCTVERLMKRLGLQGVRRGKVVRTTIGDMTAARPLDRVNRQFEAIHWRGPWKTKESVELATLEWVSWFNHNRLLGPIGYIPPPAEAEENYYRQLASQAAMVAA